MAINFDEGLVVKVAVVIKPVFSLKSSDFPTSVMLLFGVSVLWPVEIQCFLCVHFDDWEAGLLYNCNMSEGELIETEGVGELRFDCSQALVVALLGDSPKPVLGVDRLTFNRIMQGLLVV